MILIAIALAGLACGAFLAAVVLIALAAHQLQEDNKQ